MFGSNINHDQHTQDNVEEGRTHSHSTNNITCDFIANDTIQPTICVAGMNMNATGMSMHPFQWNFFVLAGKYLHYLIFDDVIMLCH